MSAAESPMWDDDVDQGERRRSRAARTAEPRLSRAHAADFAQAFDIDDAFGAPTSRFARDEDGSRVIVLERAPVVADEQDWDDERYDDEPEAHVAEPVATATVDVEHELLGEAPEIDPETGRRMVRITGRPEPTVAPRRLRELEARRPRRSVAERAASRPDRIALYAVLLGLFLVVLAAASSSAHP